MPDKGRFEGPKISLLPGVLAAFAMLIAELTNG
jgi:hypothetical protein